MATIANLTVDLTANTASFTTSLERARANVESSSAKMNKSLALLQNGLRNAGQSVVSMASSFFSLRGAITALVGAGGMGVLVTSSLSVADAIAKTADRVGLTTTAFQQYRFAAQQAGVSSEVFESAISTFNKRLGETKLGTGALEARLKQISPALLDSVKAAGTTEEGFRIIVSALSGIDDSATRAAIATTAFGDAGQYMSDLIVGGLPAIDEMRSKAEQLGLVIDESLLRQAGAVNDKFELFGTILRTKVTAEVIKLAPAIDQMASSSIQGLVDVLSNPAFREGLNFMWQILKLIGTAARELISSIGQIVTGFKQLMNVPKAIGERLGIAQAQIKLPEKFNTPERNAKVAERQARGREKIESVLPAASSIKVLEINDKIEKDAKKQAAAIKEVGDKAKETKGAVDKLKDSLGNTMSDVIEGNIRNWKDLGRTAVGVLQDILKQQAMSFFKEGISNIGGSMISNFFSGLFGVKKAHTGGVVGSSGLQSKMVDPSVFAGAQKYHTGGVVGLSPGEVPIIAKQGETVLTPEQMRSMRSSGVTVNYHIDARGAAPGVEKDIMAALQQVNASIESRAIAAVSDARRRNPSAWRG